MSETGDTKRQDPCILFLKPWSQLSGSRAKFFEEELQRELAPHHALYERPCRAIAITGASDDVLFRLDDDTFAQVHLTFTRNPPERPGWPGRKMFGTLADWMIEVMIEDHVERFGLW